MKHAAYFGTREVYGDMETSAKSLVANSDVDHVHFFIEDDEFPRQLPGIIECHNVSDQAFFPPDGANYNTPYSYMTLMRAALCHLLPDVDQVLSLDTDTVCVGYCSDIWGIDVSGCYFAATQELWMKRPGVQYCNTGVSLYNLAKLRDGKADEVMEVLNRRWYRWPEQDVFNYLCNGRIAHMPASYNWCPWVVKQESDRPRIIHYAAMKDWQGNPPVAKYRDMTWDEALERHDG